MAAPARFSFTPKRNSPIFLVLQHALSSNEATDRKRQYDNPRIPNENMAAS